MSITIRETVLDALQANGYGSYSNYAEPVIAALVEREQEIYSNLHDFATDQGLPAEQAARVFEGVGLTAPVRPEPVATTTEPTGTEVVADAVVATLERIANVLDGLTSFARQHGYRG